MILSRFLVGELREAKDGCIGFGDGTIVEIHIEIVVGHFQI